jgi:plasmid stability protein
MTSITIRDVPSETRDELASRAALAGRSLQEYLRMLLIELARQPDVATVVERMRARRSHSGSGLSSRQILGYLDSDRG